MSEGGSADCPDDRRRIPAGGRSPTGEQDEDPQRRRRIVRGHFVVEVEDRRGADAGPGGGGREPLDLSRWGLLAAAAALREGVRRPAEMGLAFVDEAEISELAAAWLQSDHPTDVLAFPVEASAPRMRRGPLEGDPPLLIGDVVVCPEVASRQAGEAGHALADELALLIVHGVLHLFGHDHAGPVESLRMKRRTRTLLARLYRPSRAEVTAPGADSRLVG
ncbi:MAG: rRNA maturation RNase YbeY [bacterium]|nr:rRNA maturation RNase YbeY [bacterium]